MPEHTEQEIALAAAKMLGRRGGNTTKKRHGVEHYRRIVRNRWENQMKKMKEGVDKLS
jgi:hypothetical protein